MFVRCSPSLKLLKQLFTCRADFVTVVWCFSRCETVPSNAQDFDTEGNGIIWSETWMIKLHLFWCNGFGVWDLCVQIQSDKRESQMHASWCSHARRHARCRLWMVQSLQIDIHFPGLSLKACLSSSSSLSLASAGAH